MKTFISDIIPKIQEYSQKLDNITLLCNQHWVVIDDSNQIKIVYIFRQNNELLISHNGRVEKAKWEYLGHNSLLIDRKNESYLFKHGFFDENILALKIDSKEEYAFLVNETKFESELNTLDSISLFLNEKYINPFIKKRIQNATGLNLNNNITSLKAFTPATPKYEITKLSDEHRLFGGWEEKYLIKFDDGEKGEIHLCLNDNEAYFIGKPASFWIKVKCQYYDMDCCVNALHHFLKTKNLLNEGFRGTY